MLLTGATSGLGKAIALRLARDGAEVIVVGRNAVRGAETVDEITAEGGRARFVAADLNDPATVPVATTAVDLIALAPGAHPGTACWLPLPGDPESGRLTLAGLARRWPVPNQIGHVRRPTATPASPSQQELRTPAPMPPPADPRSGGESA